MFTILDMFRSVLLYVFDSRISVLVVSFLFLNSSFVLILSTFLIWLSRTCSLYLLTRNSCFMTAQFFLYCVGAEQIIFSLKASIYGALLFTDLQCSDLVCKNACSSLHLQHKVVWMLLFSNLCSIGSKNTIFLGNI